MKSIVAFDPAQTIDHPRTVDTQLVLRRSAEVVTEFLFLDQFFFEKIDR